MRKNVFQDGSTDAAIDGDLTNDGVILILTAQGAIRVFEPFYLDKV